MLAKTSFEASESRAEVKSMRALMAPVGEYHDNIESAMAAGLSVAGSRAHQPGLFDRADWLQRLKLHALVERDAMIFAAKEEGGGECWLPLMRDGPRSAVALANYYNFTFGPIFRNADDPERRTALLRTLAETIRGQCDRIVVEPMADEYRAATELAAALRQAGWMVLREQCDVNHVLSVNGRSFATYWEQRPGQLRSTVKRKAKKNVVDLRIETRFTEQAWAAYEVVYAKSWKPSEGSPEFLKSLARAEGDAGTLRLGLAHIDGAPVAAQFWTVENGSALIHKLAHVEDDAKASPGTLLTHALFRHAIDIDKVRTIDFGTGNDGYKPDWMEEVRPRYRLIAVKPGKISNWRTIAGSMWRGLAARHAKV